MPDAVSSIGSDHPDLVLHPWLGANNHASCSAPLSRSATYSKEEQPQGHGEARALQGLPQLEAELAGGQVANPAELLRQRRKDIVEWSVALVDAVVATSSLSPKHWPRLVTPKKLARRKKKMVTPQGK